VGTPGDALVAGFAIAEEEFEIFLVVVGGFGPGAAVFGDVGGAEAEAIGLDLAVRGAVGGEGIGIDAEEEAARFVAGDDVGIDGIDELMVLGLGDLDAVEGFIVLGIGFATDGEADACEGHEVAFIGGVDEHFSGEGATGFHAEGVDAVGGFGDAVFQIEPFGGDEGDVGVREHFTEGLFGDFGFEGPHDIVVEVAGGFGIFGVVVAGLESPVFVIGIVMMDAGVEFPRESADGLLVADVGGTESARGESAEVSGGFDEDGGLSHAAGLDGGGDACGGATIDDDIEGFGFRVKKGGCGEEGCGEEQESGDEACHERGSRGG